VPHNIIPIKTNPSRERDECQAAGLIIIYMGGELHRRACGEITEEPDQWPDTARGEGGRGELTNN
jgi:hypothetical protein